MVRPNVCVTMCVRMCVCVCVCERSPAHIVVAEHHSFGLARGPGRVDERAALRGLLSRSEEHTSELQSPVAIS